MKHVRIVSRGHPAHAQFEALLQLVGVLNALLALYASLLNTFGIQPKNAN